MSPDELPKALRRFVVPEELDEEEFEVLSIAKAAERLHVTSQTAATWIESKRVLAWWHTRRGVLVPAEQILGPHQLTPGIESVLEMIPDARLAWDFLTQELPYFEDGPQRPLDALKAGRTAAVIRAIRPYFEAFT